MIDDFCSNCEIILPKNFFTKKSVGFRFKNGIYCEKCAHIKVNKARGTNYD